MGECTTMAGGLEALDGTLKPARTLRTGDSWKWERRALVGVGGLEPPALGLEIPCSILLSYTPARNPS